jgi:hypothetical protein
MEIEYQLTPDDLYAFQWRAVFNSSITQRAGRKVYAYWFLALLLIAVLPAIGPDGFVISRVSFTFLLVAFPAVALAQWYLTRRLMRRAILQLLKQEKPDKGHLGRHRIVLSDDGVVETTAVGESRTSWAGVDRIEQNPEYIFIYTSPPSAHVVPKRAFGNVQEAEGFYEFGRVRKEAAA